MALAFVVMKIKKNIQSMYQNNVVKKVHLLLIRKGEKSIILCSYQRFQQIHVWSLLHPGRKYFCRYYLHAFITEDILKRHIKGCFKTNSKQTIKMSKKGEYVKFKNFERKIKFSFMIYAYFESTLAHVNNIRQNPNESDNSKYQKHVACNYIYKLACVNDTFRKPFKSY